MTYCKQKKIRSITKTISQNIDAKVATINPMVENWSEGLIMTAKEIASSYTK